MSTRTVLRDVEALQVAGLPIWTTAGSGGGIHLDTAWADRHIDMTTDEAIALLVDDRRAAAAGLAGALRTARSRVRSASPPGQAELWSWIDDRFIVDPAPWFQPPPTDEAPACLATVAAAVRGGHRLDIERLVDARTRRSRVDPLGVVVKHGVHYLVATHRRQTKTYRIGRITAVHLRDEAVAVPTGFDLGEDWARFVTDFEANLRPIDATIRLDIADIDALRRALPGAETERAVRSVPADRHISAVTLRLSVEALPTAAGQLCAIPSIEVLDPPELRHAVARHATAIAHTNGGDRPT